MGEQNSDGGASDLEKELSCSICTDVLYQPLTLLDCLHTFCGSCLKEWFAWQASSATTRYPYTCPSCRAPVRDTKANATVNTLLDVFLRSHQDRGKTAVEKAEMDKIYKPGDNVVPPVETDAESDDSEGERMLAEARELSLREVQASQASVRSRGRVTTYGRHRSRQVEHQSSLRSLLSVSESDLGGVEEEILQQIVDEGLLDGIDLNNLTPAQEEDITEKIAQAFRRRQRHRSRHAPSSSPGQSRSRSSTLSTDTRRHQRETAATASGHPPPSRPHLLNTAVSGEAPRQHRRTSSLASQASVRSASALPQYDEPLIPQSGPQRPSRSATDLSLPTANPPRHRQHPVSHAMRRITDPETQHVSDREHRHRAASGPRTSGYAVSASRLSSDNLSPGPLRLARQRDFTNDLLQQTPANNSSPTLATEAQPHNNDTQPRPSTSSAAITASQSFQAAAPNVSCSRCDKSDIQHSLHYNCAKCESGSFNLCRACYRAGKGCLHWHGFGYAAVARYERKAPAGGYPDGHEKPHVLAARRYAPQSGALEEGVFCERCFECANECYWHCETCQDGAWGFCNNCVQQGKHCTHPLRAFCHLTSSDPAALRDREALRIKLPRSAFHVLGAGSPLAQRAQLPNVAEPLSFAPLSMSAHCDICRRLIPPSNTRFHCNVCNNGNYDICTSCYYALASAGKISTRDGLRGWRRCLQGHRMSIVGFEDREGGARRVVVRDMVGGWALKEDAVLPGAEMSLPNSAVSPTQWRWRETDGTAASQMSSRAVPETALPPDGGVGIRVQALWSYFPAENVKDELAFPRNAVVTEVENINGDWFWGVYAGEKGLFPGNYTREL